MSLILDKPAKSAPKARVMLEGLLYGLVTD